jgi:hypothetical protein
MKTNIKYNFLILLILVLGGCQGPDGFERSANNTISNIQAKLGDGRGSFTVADYSPTDDTLRIIIPYYYPEASSDRTPINDLIVSATLPNSAIISPQLGLMDLTDPIDISITASNGDVKHWVLKAEIRKSEKAEIESFELSSGLVGKISEAQKKIFLTTLDELGVESAIVSISPHASISPDPSTPLDYSQPQEFVVTSHSGKQVTYTVEKGEPSKAEAGFTISKLLWKKNLAELPQYGNHMQIGIAVSKEHLVIPISNEWAWTTELPYYSTKDGSYEGSLNCIGINGAIFQVANDSQGRVLGNTMAWIYGPEFTVWKWDNVNSSPEKYISWNPTEDGIAWDPNVTWGVTIGRKFSVQGDLNKDAVIYATVGNSNKVVRWIIKSGVLQSQKPEIINTGLPNWDILTKAEPTGASPNDDYIIIGNARSPLLFNGKTQKSEFSSEYPIRFSSFSAKAFTFNHVKYLCIADADDGRTSGRFCIYDINSKFPDEKVFESETIIATSVNANGTGDLAVSPVSEDGFTMTVYCVITNSAIVAYELNCIALE